MASHITEPVLSGVHEGFSAASLQSAVVPTKVKAWALGMAQ